MSGQNLIDRFHLQSFVPLNALSREHLQYLLRDHWIENRVAGTLIFTLGDRDNDNVYLVYGDVRLTDKAGTQSLIVAGDESSLFPLADQRPRPADAICETDCGLIRFDRDLLDEMLCWDQSADYIISEISAQPEMDEDADWMITLLRSNLFYRVPPMNIEDFFDRFEPLVMQAGDVVLRQGELGDCCYVIKEGEAEVLRGETPKEAPKSVAKLGVGMCFGDDALRNDKPRNATVRMSQNGVLMRLGRKEYLRLIEPPEVNDITIQEVRQKLGAGAIMLDVRSQYEYERGHCRGAPNFPLNLLKMKSRLLNPSMHYITYCNSGRRSAAAAVLLARNGFQVAALDTGIDQCNEDDRAFLTSERMVSYVVRSDGQVQPGQAFGATGS